MYFEIEGSNVCLAGTMHRVPPGQPLPHWVHAAISWACVIYVEHDEQESARGRIAPPGSKPLALTLPHSWPRIEQTFRRDRLRIAHLSRLRPLFVASDVLDLVPTDEGVEHLAIARSKVTQPPGPRIAYLESAAESYELTDPICDTVWDEAVRWALDNPASSKAVLEASYRAWFAGDFEEVYKISSLFTRNRFAPIRDANISGRNRLWLPRIRELVQSAKSPTLVLVGAAHLGGAAGLRPQLAAGGLALRQWP